MAEMDDKVIVTKDKITDIADTIRETGGTSARMTLDEMPDNIRAIGEGGGNVVAPLFIKNGNNYTCNLTFAKIEEIYAGTGDTKASMPQLIYSGNDTRSIYCNVEQENEDAFSFDFNIGAIGITNTGYKEKHIVLIMESDNSISFNREYTLEYQEDMIACKISWDSRLNKYVCNKTYAQLKDMYVDNPDSSTKLPFLCTRYGHKSNSCNVQYIEQGHLILILFFMGSIPEHIVDDQQLVYMQAIVYENGTITVGEVYKHYSKYFEPYNGIEFAQGTSPHLQLTENVRNSIATSLMIGASNGSVASFSDGGANMPMKSCIVAIEPVQSGSGDPSPSNVRPITGWTECNLNRYGKSLIDTSTLEREKYLATDGSTNNSGSSNVTDYIEIKSNTAYVFTFDFTSLMSSGNRNICFYNSNKTFISYVVYTSDVNTKKVIINTPNNAKYVRITTDKNYTDMSLNEDTIYNIEFKDGSNPLTVYGGTLDIVSGVLTVDRAMVDLGTLTWVDGGTNVFASVLSGVKVYTSGLSPYLCSNYKTINVTNQTPSDDKVVWQYYNTQTVRIKDTTYNDKDVFKEAMDGVQLVYELATPITYNLTPTEIKTLLGSNNIFADTGDVLNAEYTRDASIIINELLERVIALEQGA